MGTLYLVATPIGNLEDISARALRILKEARLIAAEDTRHTRKLLDHFQIHTPLTSYFEHNKLRKLAPLLAELEQGDVALVSDAGTPGLNDPGYELVRAALHAGYAVSPIPGPSAPLAALVTSGLPTDSFLYLGYLPRQSARRQKLLREIAGLPYTLVFLESPHRLLEALDDMIQLLGDRPAAIARELTKMYEEIFRGSLPEAREHFATQPPRGEFTLVIAGCPASSEKWSPDRLRQELQAARNSGKLAGPAASVAKQYAALSGWPKNDVYNLLKEIPNEDL